jgi:purine-binding chemotaxis protein CheW
MAEVAQASAIDASSRELHALEKRIEELKRRLEGNSLGTYAHPSHLVTLRIGDGRFAFPLEQTREVLRFAKTTQVPLAPSFVLGALNLRGKSHHVIDPLRLWGETSVVPSFESAIVVVEACSRTLCVVVDRVEDVISTESLEGARADSGAETGAGTTLSRCVSMTLRAGSELLHVLDAARLLAPALIRELDEALDRALGVALSGQGERKGHG